MMPSPLPPTIDREDVENLLPGNTYFGGLPGHWVANWTTPAGLWTLEHDRLHHQHITTFTGPRTAIELTYVTVDELKTLMAAVGAIAPIPLANEPDYMLTYRRDWADLIEPGGVFSRDQTARELSDYTHLMEEVSKTYAELTGGTLSKPNTAAHHVIEYAERKFAEIYAGLACEAAEACDAADRPGSAEALRALAEDWHQGAWDQHIAQRAKVAAIMAEGPGN